MIIESTTTIDPPPRSLRYRHRRLRDLELPHRFTSIA